MKLRSCTEDPHALCYIHSTKLNMGIKYTWKSILDQRNIEFVIKFKLIQEQQSECS